MVVITSIWILWGSFFVLRSVDVEIMSSVLEVSFRYFLNHEPLSDKWVCLVDIIALQDVNVLRIMSGTQGYMLTRFTNHFMAAMAK